MLISFWNHVNLEMTLFSALRSDAKNKQINLTYLNVDIV